MATNGEIRQFTGVRTAFRCAGGGEWIEASPTVKVYVSRDGLSRWCEKHPPGKEGGSAPAPVPAATPPEPVSASVVPIPGQVLGAIPDEQLLERYGLFRAELDALKHVLAPPKMPPPDDYEMLIFLAVARRLNLDPLVPGMVSLVGFKNREGSAVRYQAVVGYLGELSMAEATGQYDGLKVDIQREENGDPLAATCTVYRKDLKHPITETVTYAEAEREDRNPIWRDMPETMLKNAAIRRTLRLAFPKRFDRLRTGVNLEAAGVEQLPRGEKGTGLSIAGNHHEASIDTVARPALAPPSAESRSVPAATQAEGSVRTDTRVGEGVEVPLVRPSGERLAPPTEAESRTESQARQDHEDLERARAAHAGERDPRLDELVREIASACNTPRAEINERRKQVIKIWLQFHGYDSLDAVPNEDIEELEKLDSIVLETGTSA